MAEPLPRDPARVLMVEPNPVVAGLRPYSPGRPAHPLDLVLDANEALEEAPGLPAGINRYPDASGLEAQLAARLGVPAAAVLVTAGADDALERALRAVLAPGRRAVLTRPSFEMLDRYARLTGADVTTLEWWQGEWPVTDALAAADDGLAAVAVVSPNNPTGAVISRAALDQLAAGAPRALVLLDHAYAEFAGHDLTAAALAHPNVVVFRTFSKAWGAAGLRVGYAVGDERVIGWMRSVGQPYSVSALSLQAAARLLEAPPPAERVARVRRERAELTATLERLGAEVLPSQGNFVLARFADAAWVRDALAGLGIAVRAFAGRPELAGWLRLTVPGETRAFTRLLEGLEAALAPAALLLDLDGVLADVSGSYRECIRGTAASFGVAVTAAEIAAAKAGGDANNDWRLTRALLAARGVEADLAEVTRRFEALYEDDGARPGLWRTETALCAPDVLARLARRLPVGVVTGRPRAQAERFLAAAGLAPAVSTLVAMEDAPAKPDPAPVRLALARLGVARAWMVGDTPDDVRAARAAGVVPLGVVAPGDGAGTAAALEAAGAARVLTRLDELEEVLR